MTNRANPKNGMALPPSDPLQSLLDSCHRNGRPAIHAPKPEKIYFDVDMFRWWFKEGHKNPEYAAQYEAIVGMPMDSIRTWFRKIMKESLDEPT